MSYVFYPPRTNNFFPGGPPYLAGLGDYAADLAAHKDASKKYTIAIKTWTNDKKKYDAAILNWNTVVAGMNSSYGLSLAFYARDKKAWDGEAATYAVAMNGWGREFSEKKAANTTKAKQIAATFKLSLPQSFFDAGACISQADKDYFAKNCTVVKGLGAVTSYGSACGMMRLPVCNFSAKPTLRKQPSPPAKPVYPKKPTLRAPPVQPTAPTAPPAVITTPIVTTTPASVPTSPSVPDSLPTVPEETLTEEPKQANVLMGGLIAIAVLGGGYLVWRTLKKPKAQAA